MTIYNATKLDNELRTKGLEIEGVNSSGNISWGKEPSIEELALASSVLAAHNPAIPKSIDIYADLLKALTPPTEDSYEFVVARSIATWVKNSPEAMLWILPALNRKEKILDPELLKRAYAFIQEEIESENLEKEAGQKLLDIIGGLIGL